MRIAIYTETYPGLTGEGGIATYTRALAHGLSALAHEVHVLAVGDRPPASDGPVRVHFTGARRLRGVDRLFPGADGCWQVCRAMLGVARAHRIQVVEFPNWEGLGLLFQCLSRTPTVVRLHTSSKQATGVYGTPPTRLRRWDVRRERWQARLADALVTHSAAHRDEMAAELGAPGDRIHLIPHGVAVYPDFVRPAGPPGPPTVVYLGRLEQRKGTPELLQAVPRVLRAVPDARFVLIGKDRPQCPGGRTHAQYLADEFPPEVRRQVTLAGHLPDQEVNRWLQTGDVFVAPSRYESFGLVFVEAMRWGIPVVGTTAGSIPEVVEDGVSGVLVPPQAPQALGDAIARLLADPGRRRALGEAGRRRVQDQFSVAGMARKVGALYETVVGGRSCARPPLAGRRRLVHEPV